MTEPSGKTDPSGNRPFCNTPDAFPLILTLTSGWCAVEPFNVPLVIESTRGNKRYEENGSIWVICRNSSESDDIGTVARTSFP
jgi:hypothetical protein